MELPVELGLEDVGDVPHTARFLDQLKRLQGEGGYASDDASARTRELHAIALVFAHAQGTLEGAEAGIYPDQVVELLDEHERARRVPNDAARTVEERQARLVALGASRRGASAADLEAALERLGIDATVHSTPRATFVAEGGPADTVFQLAVTAPAADQTPAKRRAAVDLLRRALPVLQFGQRNHATPEEMLVQTLGPTWADAAAILGQCALEANDAIVQTRAPSRLKEYSRLTRLTARDLNAIQTQMLVAACPTTNDLRHKVADSRFIAFAAKVAAGTTVTIDNSVDCKYRLARVALLYSTDATDYRPVTGTAETSLNGLSYFERLWYTGAGSSSYELTISGVGKFLGLTTLSFTSTAASDRVIVGFIELSGDVRYSAGGDLSSTIRTFEDGLTLLDAKLVSTWWTSLRAAAGLHRANGSGVDSWTGFGTSVCGGLSRQCVLAQSIRPGSGANTFVLDSTVDWKDRMLFVEVAVAGLPVANYVGFPGGPSDFVFSTYPTISSRVGYTGTGVTPGGASLSDFHIPLENGLRVGARSSDGALIIEHTSSSGGSDVQTSAILIVHATDKLKATAIPNPVAAVDGDPIVAETLNGVQDAGMLTQGRALEPSAGGTPIPVDGMPLGPAVRGSPRVPIAFSITRRDGRRNQLPFERRQPVAGRLRRVFAISIPTATSYVLDSTEDWRDRFVVGWFARSTSDIRPEQSHDYDIASGVADATRLPTYLGSGRPSGAYVSGQYHLAIAGTALLVSARATDGALELRNDTGGTRYVVGWLEAGFPLGPRSA